MVILRRWSVAIVIMLVAVGMFFFTSTFVREQAWSNPSTWASSPPRADGDVTIAAGKTVVLDVDPPRLRSLDIEGSLIVADRDVRIEAASIIVHGSLTIGEEHHRFAHRAKIVLDGSTLGDGVLLVSNGGKLTLWGAQRRSWTHVASTAGRDSRQLVVADRIDWQPGDELVVAPSGFDPAQAEHGRVVAVSDNALTLADPLRFRHWGTVTSGVDERAEVGLITHNIVVTSEPHAALHGWGGQVMVMRGGQLDVGSVEFNALGQAGKLGRYPIHFHLAGDARGSRIAASSIVHSRNRCLTIHGTDNVVVRENVADDTIGHCFFLEDGIEVGNVFEKNLALETHAASTAHAILETDTAPASYWIANPANTLIGNIAAGSDGNGFWYSLSPHPTGPSATSDIWPRRTSLGQFAHNVAHSNTGNGLFVDILHNPPGVSEAPNYNPPTTADFATFEAYKNRKRGVWLRGTNLRLTAAVIADNSIGVTFAGANAILRDSLVVGATDNQTGPPKLDDPAFPIRGFEFYDGRVGVEHTHFANFVSDPQRPASALSVLRFSPFFTDPTNYARALTFDHAQRVFLEPQTARHDRLGADGYRAAVFHDLDGSVTGTQDTSVTIDTPLVAHGGCRAETQWRALVCPANFGSVFIVDVNARGRSPGPVHVALVENAAQQTVDPLRALTLIGNPQLTPDAIFQANVRSSQTYRVSFERRFPAHLRLGLHHFAAGERLTLVFPQAPRDLMLANGTQTSPEAIITHRADGTLILDLGTSSATRHGATVIDLCASGRCS